MLNTRFIKLKTAVEIISSELLNFTEHKRDITQKIKFSSFHKTMFFNIILNETHRVNYKIWLEHKQTTRLEYITSEI